VVHAQTLRTALAGVAPQEASRPLTLVLVSLAALLFLVREPRYALLLAALTAAGALGVSLASLRSGTHLSLASVLFTLAAAAAARAFVAWRERRRP
jgi:CHASE2 domain-containing sensor protein